MLAGFGLLFFLWRGALVVQALSGQAALAGPELATGIADLILTPTWAVGGILLWRRPSRREISG